EGVSLFSSFAVLLSFNYFTGRFKGLMQIISWSALDEQLHSHIGCLLFKELVKEKPLTIAEKVQIINGFKLVVENEIAFINNIFNNRTSDYISAEQLINYIYYRANERLNFLGITNHDVFSYDKDLCKQVKDWFEPIISGNSSTDFFSQSKDGANYTAKPTLEFNKVDLGSMFQSLLEKDAEEKKFSAV
ncbi:MAG: ribonucleotide-diphosphate reductase subunit beta, partial [Nitrososphaeraceae archaeon]|nr:ribonucleotide-diphosphate reductase subunit beta [Nitrososphaeraceae archaeon]